MNSKRSLDSKRSVNWTETIKSSLKKNGVKPGSIVWIPYPITEEILAEDKLIEGSFVEAWASDNVEDALSDRYLVLDTIEEDENVVVLDLLGGITLNQRYQLPFVLFNYELIYGIQDAFSTAVEVIEDIKTIR